MPVQLRGSSCLLTGGSRGLGRHIALALAKEGARLHLVARSAEGLAAVAREVEAAGAGAEVHAVDVSDHAAVGRLIAALDRDSGIDVLINNAGIESVAYLHEQPIEEMLRVIEVNLTSALVLTRLVLPGMVARARGHVVNIASLAGKSGPPLAETYAVSKAGLIALAQSLRASYAGRGVSASAVCPGYIRGEGMFADRARAAGDSAPPKVIGTSAPEDVGRAVVRAIVEDVPEILVTPTPARLFAAVGQLQPRFPGWLMRKLNLRSLYEKQRKRH
jgi:short-subunit dehydrogenase